MAGLLQKMQAIKQGQMALDQAKAQLQGQAAAFANMNGGGQMGGAPPQQQPPMPGQSSAPPPQQGGGGMPPMGGNFMSMTSPMGMPQGGPPQMNRPMPPMAQPQPQGAPPMAGPPGGGGQPQMGQAPMGGADNQPTDPRSVVMQIAQTIAQRNPGIKPEVLFSAVQQTIDLMKGIAPDYRAQMQLLATQMRTQSQEGIAAGHDETRVKTEGMRDTTSRANTTDRINASATQLADRLKAADERLDKTQRAIDARQDKSLGAKAEQTVQKGRARVLKDQLAQARAQASQTFNNPNATQADIDKANANVNTILTRITLLDQAVSKGQKQPAPAKAGGTTVLKGPDGKSYNVPNDKVDAFIAAGGHP